MGRRVVALGTEARPTVLRQGRVSTTYTCCSNTHPNLFSNSLPAEAAFLPVYCIANQFDGYLHSSWMNWDDKSLTDTRYRLFAPGDIYKHRLGRTFPMLTGYYVTIPPGGRTDAFVQTVITWQHEGKTMRTRGLDADQIEAAIQATLKMLNIIEPTE